MESSWEPAWAAAGAGCGAGAAAFSCRPVVGLNFGAAGGCCLRGLVQSSVSSWGLSPELSQAVSLQAHTGLVIVRLLCTRKTLGLKTWSHSWMSFHTLVVKISLGILLLCQWDKSRVLWGFSFPVHCPKFLMGRGMKCRLTQKQELQCGHSPQFSPAGVAVPVVGVMPGANWL